MTERLTAERLAELSERLALRASTGSSDTAVSIAYEVICSHKSLIAEVEHLQAEVARLGENYRRAEEDAIRLTKQNREMRALLVEYQRHRTYGEFDMLTKTIYAFLAAHPALATDATGEHE